MKPQEIFDKAYLGLKAQGRQSRVEEGNMCLYHGPDGSHCGVGFLVSPDVAAAWDKRGVTEIETLLDTDANEDEPHVLGIEPWMHANRKLLVQIQEAHDSAKFWHRKNDGFEANFARVARLFGLTIPQVSA